MRFDYERELSFEDELTTEFKRRIDNTKNKNAEIHSIIKELITYINQKRLSIETSIQILESLKEELLLETVIVHSCDNKEHFDLIDRVIRILNGK